MNNIIIPNTMMMLNSFLINNYEDLEYDSSMEADKLMIIGDKYINRGDTDNMKICLYTAIEKKHVPSMLYLAKYFRYFEYNIDEMLRLYNLAIENGSNEGAYSLSEYYKTINDSENVIKYLNISINNFNDQESMIDIINYYSDKNDEVNCMKYADKLIEHNPIRGNYIKGKMYQRFKKYTEMKLHYEYFLNTLEPDLISLNNEELTYTEKQFLSIIKLYMDNDINIPYIQNILHKFNISDSSILGHIQFKLNKIRIKEPLYSMIGSCNICFGDNIKLQLYDCLGHYYCEECTINMDKCAICRCSKKCSHI
jgi:hypothetical protein